MLMGVRLLHPVKALEQKPRLSGEKKKTYQHSPPKGSQRTVVLLFVENQNHLESIFQTRFLALSRLSFKEHPGD